MQTITMEEKSKISMLENYTHVETSEFIKHFNFRVKKEGLISSYLLRKKLSNFNNLTEYDKTIIVQIVEDDEYIIRKPFLLRLFNL
jgi:hypothetical protein